MKGNILVFTILITYLFYSTNTFGQKIKRVEPVHWWVGFEHKQLQLMVYGNDIAMLKPKIDYKNVEIQSVTRLENPNYLFIDILLNDSTLPGKFYIDFMDVKRNKVKVKHLYTLKKRIKDAYNIQGYSPKDVIYLITPDRFANGDPANDNNKSLKEQNNRSLKGGRHGGDLAGITKNLDYIQSMGFTAIWLNPILENDMPSYSYHGYATTDFYKVDPRYGTLDDYKALISKAKKMNIKVIMDMIVNHCGSEHWWMKDLPTKKWINNDNVFKMTNHKKAVIQDPYVSQKDYKDFVDGWFVKQMPDLNQKNPQMHQYLIQNTIWWIEETGLNGIRMDTYPYPDKDFMTDWTCSILNEYPNFGIVGEEWHNDPAIVSFWQMGKLNPNGYESCLPSLMDFPVQYQLSKALSEHKNFDFLYETVAKDFLYAAPEMLVTFPDNHDMDRFFTQVNEDLDLFKMGIVFTLTFRGIPQLYYGTEILMKNPDSHDHGIIRSDFPGGWHGDNKNGFTGEGLSKDEKQAQIFIKKLLNWRKGNTAVHNGNLLHYIPQNNIYVYFRYTSDDIVMVALNLNDESIRLKTERFDEIISPNDKVKNVLTNKVDKIGVEVLIPKKGFILYEIHL